MEGGWMENGSMKREEFEAQVDEEGRLVLPPELIKEYGLNQGTKVRFDKNIYGFRLQRPITHLAKVYIEPTNSCNLECRTCIRNSWEEPLGEMSLTTFTQIIEGLQRFPSPPTIFFGGLGEPLAHLNIVEMVARAKAIGSTVELITNGTLLSKSLSEDLINAGLDRLWVSLDGATPESYADVRLGAALPEVISNLASFQDVRLGARFYEYFVDYHLSPQIGIVFVAMKRNITDLPSVIRLGLRYGANHFLVTNVLPYTAEMYQEILYSRASYDGIYIPSSLGTSLNLPKIDIHGTTQKIFNQIMLSGHHLIFAGADLGEGNHRCPFIETGAMAIRWDGEVSPCLPLLHDQKIFMNGYERSLRRYAVGKVPPQGIWDLWNLPEYLAFRERVQKFDFSPCTFCGGCDLFESNEEDCLGSPFPTCGGCLWAQGEIQCP